MTMPSDLADGAAGEAVQRGAQRDAGQRAARGRHRVVVVGVLRVGAHQPWSLPEISARSVAISVTAVPT